MSVKLSPAARSLKAKLGELSGKKTRKESIKANPAKYQRGMGSDFYQCREWRELRWQVLKENAARQPDKKARCEACGVGAEPGSPLHVDHKKPRHYFPHLELVKSNMQVLCEPCNLGKGASL